MGVGVCHVSHTNYQNAKIKTQFYAETYTPFEGVRNVSHTNYLIQKIIEIDVASSDSVDIVGASCNPCSSNLSFFLQIFVYFIVFNHIFIK